MYINVKGGTGGGRRRVREQVKQDWKCENCGARNRYYWIKCPNCGYPREG